MSSIQYIPYIHHIHEVSLEQREHKNVAKMLNFEFFGDVKETIAQVIFDHRFFSWIEHIQFLDSHPEAVSNSNSNSPRNSTFKGTVALDFLEKCFCQKYPAGPLIRDLMQFQI
jgi:hypothetical protein